MAKCTENGFCAYGEIQKDFEKKCFELLRHRENKPMIFLIHKLQPSSIQGAIDCQPNEKNVEILYFWIFHIILTASGLHFLHTFRTISVTFYG
jgi:hypothetical protein